MRPEDLPEMRNLALFRVMSDESFQRLIRGAYLQTFPPQVQLAAEGDMPDFLQVLLEGSVELYAKWGSRETTMDTLVPVSAFILAASLCDRPYLMSARTLEKSRIALLPSENVRAVFVEDNAFALALAMELAGSFRASVRQMKNLKLRSSVERLANYLLRQHGCKEREGCFELPYEKRLLASHLGMTPENLSRAFASLKPFGVVVDGARVRITLPDDLRRLAKPSPLIDGPDC